MELTQGRSRDGFYTQEEEEQEDGSKRQIATIFPLSSLPSSSSSSSASSSSSVVPLTWAGVEKEHMFEKVVTPSDVGKLNRLVIPKQYAEKFFPLDSSSNEKGLLLSFEDRNGKPWCFRYSYWNSSQSYVMTKGWSRFVKEKQLDAGDTVSFSRAADRRLFIDWKRRPYVHDPPRIPGLPLPSISFARAAWGGRLFVPPPHQPPAATLYEHHQRQYAYDYTALMPQFAVPVVLDSMPVVDSQAAAKRVRLFGVDLDRPLLQLPPCGSGAESSAASPSSSSEKDQHSLDLDLCVLATGTPVCRARCFPVGKVLDFMLPEFLNCTARTGLDMLARHYYQASSTWVVFFVPETDADITFYNEFMHYLGEKQRAAVAKLGERTTLFLVPPSEFSEKVLKVPGKVSISGVILKFQQPSSSFNSLHQLEESELNAPPLAQQLNVDIGAHELTFRKPNSPDFRTSSQGQNYFSSSLAHLTPVTSAFPPQRKFGDNPSFSSSLNPPERLSEFRGESGQDQLQQQNPTLPSSSWLNKVHSNIENFPSFTSLSVSRSSDNSTGAFPFSNTRVAEGTTSNNHTPETSGIIPLPTTKIPPQLEDRPQSSSSMPLPLQPEQLAQLAALLGQQKQPGKGPALSMEEEKKRPSLSQIPSSHVHASMLHAAAPVPQSLASLSHVPASVPQAHASGPPSHPVLPTHSPSGSLGFQITHAQHYQHQQPNVPSVPVVNAGQESSQQTTNTTRDDTEPDPEKRLQATLQLAAALLQQIQNQSKTGDQH